MLDPRILSVFREARVEMILHGGDVCNPATLAKLGTVAPVAAVYGNRDWLFLRNLPRERYFDFEGVSVAMTHGHGRWWNYLMDRAVYMATRRLDEESYLRRLAASYPQAQVIIFGHLHRPIILQIDGQLIFNPGSAHFPQSRDYRPAVGLLRFEAGRVLPPELVYLD
jgi:putative phosphoesterase